MVTTQTALSPEAESRQRHALRFGVLRLVGDVALAALTLVLIFDPGSWQSYVLIAVQSGIIVSTIIGLASIRGGRTTQGVGTMAGGLLLGMLLVSVFVQGLGLFVLAMLVIVNSLVVSITVPRRRAVQALLASVTIGLAALVFDAFMGGTAFRLPASPQLNTFMWLVLAALTVGCGWFVLPRFGDFSLQTKLLSAFVVVGALSLGLLTFFYERNTRRTLTENANEALLAAASRTASSVEDFIDSNLFAIRNQSQLQVLVDYLELSPGRRDGSPEEAQVRATLQTLRNRDEIHISSYALLDRNGIDLIDTNADEIGSDKSDRDWFRRAIESMTYTSFISPFQISPTTGSASLYFSSPVLNARGESIGVLRLRYNASILQLLVSQNNYLVGRDSFAVLFDENLIHLAHGTAPETIFTTVVPLETERKEALQAARRLPQAPEEEIFLDLPELGHHLNIAATGPEEVRFFTAEDVATGERLNQVVVVRLEEPTWLLAFFQPRDVFLAPAIEQARTTALLGVLISGLVIALAIGLAQRLSRPIVGLTETVAQVSEGDLSVRAEVSTQDEIGKLAATFNDMAAQLEGLIAGLEEQVAARTRDLERRALQLQTAALVARDATAEANLDDLLAGAVNLVRTRFDLHHAGIFLVGDREEFAVLMSATGDTGQHLLESEYKVKVGSETAVGYVTSSGTARLYPDPEAGDTGHAYHLLPESRSQLVLPLRVGDRMLGALDLHSTEIGAFEEEDISIFQGLADQLAVAIQKTYLREEVEAALQEVEAAYGRYTRQSWRTFAQAGAHPPGYRYRELSVQAVSDQPDEVRVAWERGEAVITSQEAPSDVEEGESSLAVPLKVRGEVIGVLNLKFEGEAVPADSKGMVEEIASRLGLVLENARLVEVAQRRLENERLASQITGRMRQKLEIDSLLRAAVEEIGQSLGFSEVEVVIGSAQSQTDGGADGGDPGGKNPG